MMKRFLTLAMALILLFCALPLSVSAADTVINNEKITPYIGIYIPKTNGSATAKVLWGVPMVSEGDFTWTDVATGKVLGSGDRFEYQKEYTLDLTLEAKDGYYFDASKPAKFLVELGDIDHSVYCTGKILSSTQCSIQVTVQCQAYILDDVSFLIEVPHQGYLVSKSVDYVHGYFTLQQMRWIDDETGKELSEDERFGERGRTYTVELTFDADEGFEFETKHIFRAFENDHYYEILSRTNKRVVVSRSYRCTELISTAYAEIREPVAGEHPSYEVTFPQDAHYVSGTPTVSWYELGSPTTKLTADSVFENGKQYQAYVYIIPESEDYYIWLSHAYINGKGAKYGRYNGNHGSMNIAFTCGESKTYPVTVNVTSFLSKTDTVTIQLLRSGYVFHYATPSGTQTSVNFTDVEAGTYTLRVRKKNHVQREYTVNITGSTTLNAQINPIGDVTGDGKITVADAGKINNHIKKKATLTGYEFDCADVDSNSKITVADAGKLYNHIKKKATLW